MRAQRREASGAHSLSAAVSEFERSSLILPACCYHVFNCETNFIGFTTLQTRNVLRDWSVCALDLFTADSLRRLRDLGVWRRAVDDRILGCTAPRRIPVCDPA